MEKLMFKIDWLAFNYNPKPCEYPDPELSLFENFLTVFPEFDLLMESMTLLPYGRLGYKTVYQYYDEFTISYHPQKSEMGVHVEFSSKSLYRLTSIFGCRSFEDYQDARHIFQILKDRNCKIGRLDIAYDDFSKVFMPLDFNKWKIDGRLSTKCSHWHYIGNNNSGSGTFYLGKRGKDRFLRIYDKEYESKGAIPAIRYEFELRGRWSAWVQDQIINEDCFTVADLLDSMLVVKEEYNTDVKDSVRSVYKCVAAIDEQWSLFLDSIRQLCAKGIKAEVVVSNIKEEESFFRTEKWLSTQVFKSLLIFCEVVGLDKLPDLLESSRSKLKPSDYKLLEKYKLEYNSRVS